MGLARYEIVPAGRQWAVRHEGAENLEYSTKESAFESAAAAPRSQSVRDTKSISLCLVKRRRSRNESSEVQ
jgi:hypothetical protein